MSSMLTFLIGNKMSSQSSAFSSSQVSRQVSPVVMEPKKQPGRLTRMARGIGAGAAWTLATADNAANFINKHPGISLIATALGAGGFGTHLYKQAHAPRVATVKAEPVRWVPKEYAPTAYYGPDTRHAAPPNSSKNSKFDKMFTPVPTPESTPTPSITTPMNSTAINVVNHNSTKS